MISDGARAALEKSELFQDIDRSKLADVAALVEERELVPDEILIRQSESALYVFVVVEGRGIAKLMVDRGWLSLGLIEPGDVAGWSSLIQAQRYPASVKVLTPMRVARIEAGRLTHLMNLEPGIGYPVHRRLSAIFHRQYEVALNALRTRA